MGGIDPALVGAHNLVADCQTQAGALLAFGSSGIGAIEWFE